MRTERIVLPAFDGSVSWEVGLQESDKIRELEDPSPETLRIAKGGGYSYAALSVGEKVTTQSLRHFNRILEFSPERNRIVVEPGITLGELFRFTAPRGLYLSVQPGYPAITVGGCVASNVHGKNPYIEGTFENRVEALTLFHPLHGLLTLSQEHRPDLFTLTCGGLGLTGIIRSVTLRLSPLAGHRTRTSYHKIASLPDGYARLLETCDKHDMAYTWHNGFTRAGQFGRGFLVLGSIVPGRPPLEQEIPPIRALAASRRGRGYPQLWSRLTAGCANTVYLPLVGRRPHQETDVFHSLFPLYGRELYFNMYGRRGFFEYQVLVGHRGAIPFLEDLTDLLLKLKAPSTFVALRMFKGKQALLKFDGDGVALALDMPRTVATTRIMHELNRLMLDHGALPFVVKNSSLTQEVVQGAYPEYTLFKEKLREFDPKRLFRSHHTERLGL